MRLTPLITAVGIIATGCVAAFGLPGPIDGLIWYGNVLHDPDSTLKVATGTAAAFLAIAALGRYELSRIQNQHAKEQVRIAEQSQINDRFTRAIEQLGHTTTSIRLGAIYALEHIAIDSPQAYGQTVIDVLSSYVRELRPTRSPDDPITNGHGLSTDQQSALTVVGRSHLYLRTRRIDLSETDMSGANMSGAGLHDANLVRTNLTRTNLTDAHLSGANLTEANLTNAILRDAHLAESDLTDADLTDAKLVGANLTDADLTGTNLTRAILTRANLTDAEFFETDLSGADLIGANLTRVEITNSNLAGANLTGANLTDANLTGANLTGAKLTDANLTGANLTGAELFTADLTRAELFEADLTDVSWDTATLRPKGLAKQAPPTDS